jgi:hypothetical protein
MPAKGSSLKHGDRTQTLDKSMWKKYVEETGSNISWADFKSIVSTSNELISQRVLHNVQGYKLSESLGYIAVKRYKAKPGKRSVDFKRSKELGTIVYHTNFHSHGYKARITWYTAKVSNCKYINIYKFIPDRAFQRGLGKMMLSGKIYNDNGYEYYKAKKINLNFNRLD